MGNGTDVLTVATLEGLHPAMAVVAGLVSPERRGLRKIKTTSWVKLGTSH